MSNLHIYIDGPTEEEMLEMSKESVSGFTFNPTLFKNLGVTDYLDYSKRMQQISGTLPISLEVIGDSHEEIITQGRKLAALGSNVFVKIPITFTSGESSLESIKTLSEENINLNITAVFTIEQIKHILPTIKDSNAIISVFAGRLFDVGLDAKKIMQEMAEYIHSNSNCSLLWASPRMHYDAISAEDINCDIITMTYAMYKKMSLIGKSPEEYSVETVKMFFDDAQASGFKL
tara:strand:- start:703 stop:1398 length:696 start_codon:yes stop_codon:yes gene_type:complete